MKLIEENDIDVINRRQFKVGFIRDILIAVYNNPRVDAKGINKDGLVDFLQENHATNGTAAEIAKAAGMDTGKGRDVQDMGEVEVPYVLENFLFHFL